MEPDKVAEYIDQQRWLMNNGLVPDSVKNQLFACGSIVHQNVQAVELDLHAENKLIEYTIFVDKVLLKKIEKYKKLSTATSLFGMWRFKRFLEKEGSLDFQSMLSKFVTDFCGPKWTTKVTVADFDVYIDKIGVEGESDGASQPADKLPD